MPTPTSATPSSAETAGATVVFPLRLYGQERPVPLPAPTGPATVFDLLPAARAFSQAATDAVLSRAADRGEAVSCKPGCAACCRQLVAVSTVEAAHLASLVQAMPRARRSEVAGRFAAAVEKLKAAGFLSDRTPASGGAFVARPVEGGPEAIRRDLSRRYFALQIACPFLDDGNCTIHPERPNVCREYHVTSPASECARLHDPLNLVRKIESPVDTGAALSATAAEFLGTPAGTMPLILSLEWARAHAGGMRATRDGRTMFDRLAAELRAGMDAAATAAPSVIPEGSVAGSAVAAPGPVPPSAPTSATPSPSASPVPAGTYDTANVHLDFRGVRRVIPLPVHLGPSTAFDLLTPARELTRQATDAAIAQVVEKGETISCKAGCGACCRQLVSVSTVEAVRLARVVAEMPEPRRSAVRDRFAAAVRRLESVGLLDPEHPRGDRSLLAEALPDDAAARTATALKYFAAGVPCPFLEDESCSIHPERPVVCREYHVTSPPEECAKLAGGGAGIRKVAPALHAGGAMTRAAARHFGSPANNVPLTLLLEWADARPGLFDRSADGLELFKSFLSEIDKDHEREFAARG
jgi:Fe-S-cluster containining protein